jgi:sugar/nucleoside kinase (ribokinase family)
MNTLICGSLAYDTIMVFPDKFKNHILPEQIHILNVSFFVPEMRREFGGCAGNIAYNLKLLGGKPLMMATAGDDFAPYSVHLDKLKLSQKHVRIVSETFTAQAFITTDLDDNQITAFHPGAMSQSHLNHIADADNVELGIISPDGRDGMVQHAREFNAANIPFIFDPGQGMPMFDGNTSRSTITKRKCWKSAPAKLSRNSPSWSKRLSSRAVAKARRFMRTARNIKSLRCAQLPWLIRPVVAMRIARVCFTALAKNGIGKKPASWRA